MLASSHLDSFTFVLICFLGFGFSSFDLITLPLSFGFCLEFSMLWTLSLLFVLGITQLSCCVAVRGRTIGAGGKKAGDMRLFVCLLADVCVANYIAIRGESENFDTLAEYLLRISADYSQELHSRSLVCEITQPVCYVIGNHHNIPHHPHPLLVEALETCKISIGPYPDAPKTSVESA